MESTWNPVCITFALVNIAYLERTFVGFYLYFYIVAVHLAEYLGHRISLHRPKPDEAVERLRKSTYLMCRYPIPSKNHPGEKSLYLDPCCPLGSWDTDTKTFYSMKSNTWMQISCKDLQFREKSHRRTCWNIHYVLRNIILLVVLLLLELVPEWNSGNAVSDHHWISE